MHHTADCSGSCSGRTGCAGKRVATTFTEINKHLAAGTTVYVTTNDGTEVRGELDTVSGASARLLLQDATTREFSEADVARVTTKDTLWSGLLIGAGLGGAFGFMLNDESCFPAHAPADCRKASRSVGVAATAALGGALGAAVDALHRQRVFHGTRTAGISLSIAPLIAPRGVAIAVSTCF